MRCAWVKLSNPLYVKYHDEEWGKLNTNEHYIYEMFILECFQAGLSWECILGKRDSFRNSYDNFDIDKIINYDDKKINELLNNKSIIRNKSKILASINNSKIYKDIINEYGSFYNYLCKFTKNKVYYNSPIIVRDNLSDMISIDLISRGMKYVGSITIYSFLQAIGIINSHEENCDFK